MQKWFTTRENAPNARGSWGAALWPMGAGKCRSIPRAAGTCPPPRRASRNLRRHRADPRRIRHHARHRAPRPANSNYLQKIGETAAFAKALNLPNCRVMCDLRHMLASGDSNEPSGRTSIASSRAHRLPVGPLRKFPDPDDGFDYRPTSRAQARWL